MQKKKLLAVFLVVVLLALACCSGGGYVENTSKKLSDYIIEATFDDSAKKISAVEIFSFTNRTEAALTELKFHLYPNAYRKESATSVVPTAEKVTAYVNGYSYGDVSVDSVKIDDVAVAFTIGGTDNDILCVPLGAELFPNEKVVVTVVFEVALANIWHRLGYADNTVNLANWFPILCYLNKGEFVANPYYSNGDPFVSDLANFKVSLTLPKTYKVASSGVLEEQSVNDFNIKYTFTAKAVRDFATVISTKFETLEQTVGNTTVKYSYFNDPTPAENLTLAVNALKFFNNLMINYPYSTLTVVQTDFCFAGMEYPQMVMVAGNLEEMDYKKTIVHEIAHQWLYGLVGNDQINEAWLDEGLVEFVSLLFFEQYSDYGVTRENEITERKKLYTTYVDVLGTYLPNLDLSMNRALNQYVSEQEYVYMTYVKGCIMFNELYELLGKDKFVSGLRKYVDGCKMTMATPTDLIASFSKVYGSDLTPWFDNYLKGKDKMLPTK